MKKIVFTIIIMIISIVPVFASNNIEEEITSKGTYINKNNLVITSEMYKNIKDTLSIEEIENMKENLYNTINMGKYKVE